MAFTLTFPKRSTAKSVETPYMKIWIEENILHCKYAEDSHINILIARHCVQARLSFSQGISYSCFVDMRGVKSATKEAGEYLANEGAKLITAGALLIHSPLTRALGNIFLLINKPNVPGKLFTDEREAIIWLKQYL